MHTCRYIVPVGVVGVLDGNEKDRVLSFTYVHSLNSPKERLSNYLLMHIPELEILWSRPSV